jgi:outer membrane receptor for ferric coprogen and ferric-rhodotorulic acid
MKTRQQNIQAKHGVIYALLALAGIAPAAWAQTENAQAQETPVVLDTLEVTGSPYLSEVSVGGKEPVKPREIPQSVSVITKERIEEQGLVTLTDALNQVTGVNFVSNDTTQSQFRSRGFALNLSHDGIPVYSSFSGYQQLDLAIYEQVEVLRGPAGLYQGTGDFGGTVNLVRKRGQKEFAASGSVSAGSWSNYNTVADVTGPLNADGSLRARAVVSITDRDYFYKSTHTRKYLGYGTLDWDITPATTLSLAFISQHDDTDVSYMGLPARSTGELLKVSRKTHVYPDWNRYEWETQDLLAELTHRFDNGWNATAKLRHRDQDFYFKDGFPNVGVSPTGTIDYTRRVRDYRYAQDAFDFYLTGPFRLFGKEHRAVLGYNSEILRTTWKGANAPAVDGIPFGRPDLVPSFDLPYNLGGESESRQSGFYGQVRLRLADPLTAIVGARISDFRSRSRTVSPNPNPTAWDGPKKTNDEVTPYGGLIFDVNKQVSLYASYSDLFIPQTSYQKANGGFLDPRVGKQYEIGSKGEFFDGRLIASIAYFNIRDENRAYQDPDNPDFYLNAGEVESKGWEVEVSGSPAPGWNLQAGYTHQVAKYLKDRNNEGLPFSTWDPKHMLKLWGTYRFQGGTLNGLSVGLGANYNSETKAGNGTSNVRRQSGHTVVDAFLSYRIDKNLSLSLNVNNLFDKTYYTRLGGTNTYNTYGAPRNFALTLRATY